MNKTTFNAESIGHTGGGSFIEEMEEKVIISTDLISMRPYSEYLLTTPDVASCHHLMSRVLASQTIFLYFRHSASLL